MFSLGAGTATQGLCGGHITLRFKEKPVTETCWVLADSV